MIGKFKDESSGDPIIEFVGLRPKMYSFTTLNNAQRLKEKHRAKGIQYAAAKALTHAQYIAQLEHPTENRLINRRIGSHLHVLYTFATSKRALCAFDDKRYLCEDGIHTLAFGHKNLPDFVKVLVDAEHPMDQDAADLLEQDDEFRGALRERERRRVEIVREETRLQNEAADFIERVEAEMEGEAAVAAGAFDDDDYAAVVRSPPPTAARASPPQTAAVEDDDWPSARSPAAYYEPPEEPDSPGVAIRRAQMIAGAARDAARIAEEDAAAEAEAAAGREVYGDPPASANAESFE